MGVWIETLRSKRLEADLLVTPCMGVWIETISKLYRDNEDKVTPCMGVWIETKHDVNFSLSSSHTLYGCVD